MKKGWPAVCWGLLYSDADDLSILISKECDRVRLEVLFFAFTLISSSEFGPIRLWSGVFSVIGPHISATSSAHVLHLIFPVWPNSVFWRFRHGLMRSEIFQWPVLIFSQHVLIMTELLYSQFEWIQFFQCAQCAHAIRNFSKTGPCVRVTCSGSLSTSYIPSLSLLGCFRSRGYADAMSTFSPVETHVQAACYAYDSRLIFSVWANSVFQILAMCGFDFEIFSQFSLYSRPHVIIVVAILSSQFQPNHFFPCLTYAHAIPIFSMIGHHVQRTCFHHGQSFIFPVSAHSVFSMFGICACVREFLILLHTMLVAFVAVLSRCLE
jgi:hypothetical protein